MGLGRGIRIRNEEWNHMFHPKQVKGTDMNNEEALEIVLALARGTEWDDEQSWEDSDAEACGIVDGMLADMATE